MTHKLPKLPYSVSALEPYIDARTMGIHHDKHHAAYVDNLNNALQEYPDLQDLSAMQLIRSLDTVPEEIRTSVRNNGGGHVNHSIFWNSMRSASSSQPAGKLAEDMDSAFGSFGNFKSLFTEAAMTRFGSGWAWLCVDADGGLMVTSTPNQDNPAMDGQIPLLGLDVWEHAYYLTYQNRRADYVDAWWHVVDWDYIAGNYTAIQVGAHLDRAAGWAQQQWSKLEDAWNKLVDAD